MASTYSNLKIQLMTTGENLTNWGDVTNTNLGTALEEAIAGSADVAFSSADVTLTLTNTNATQTARNMRLNLTGTSGGARVLNVPAIEKMYVVNNGLADACTVKVSGQTGVSVPAGKTMVLFNNGTDVVNAVTHLSSLTLASALPVASGGTGVTSSTGTGSVVLSASPTFTGTPSLPTGTIGVTQAAGTSSATLATTAFVQAALAAIYPVGSIYTNATVSTNPGTLLGFGTWTAFGAGRVAVGYDASNALFDTAEETGGYADQDVVTHTHTFSATTDNPGNHVHYQYGPYGGGGNPGGSLNTSNPGGQDTSTTAAGAHTHTVSGTTSSAGSSGTNKNYQPYITVYMWKRTA